MSYVDYDQASVGGKQVAEAMARLQQSATDMETLGAWINSIGSVGLQTNSDFLAPNGAAFNDTFLQIAAAYAAFMGDGGGGTNAEKIARLARGS